MITASQLSLRRGSQLLFADAGFTLHAGWRVGLVVLGRRLQRQEPADAFTRDPERDA